METTEEGLVVGFGLRFSANEIAGGRMPYHRVKAVWFLAPDVLDDEKLELWIHQMQSGVEKLSNEAATVVRRLWKDGLILQPEPWGIPVITLNTQCWKPWSEYTGGSDEQPGEGGS